MFKKIAIAAACSIALYGLAKVIRSHILLVPDRLDRLPADEVPEAGVDAAAPENGQPVGDSGDASATVLPVNQAAGVQASGSSGEAAAVNAVPSGEVPCL